MRKFGKDDFWRHIEIQIQYTKLICSCSTLRVVL